MLTASVHINPPSCPAASNARLVGDPVDTLTGAVFDGKLEFRLIGPRHRRQQCKNYDAES